MDERMLIRRAVAGDKEAFASLYMLYRDPMYRYAYFRLSDEGDAQDAVSACIAEAYANIASLRREDAFRSWIFRILYRCCCAIVRDRVPADDREDIEILDTIPAPEPDRISPELSEAFGVLGDEEREIVLLSAVAGYSSREIGSLMSLKPSTVRSRLSRALSKMRTFLIISE